MATKRVDKNNPVVREILRQGKGKDPRLVAAALETGRIESNFTNLPGGDADSVNWRQERASIYGGDMSIRRSVARFYKEAEGLDKGQASYELAADVQRPRADLRGRYKTAHSEALDLLRGGSQAPPQAPSAPAYQSVTTTTPGVDNSQQRKLAVASFLGQGGVKNASAVTQLAGTYGQLADVPGTTSTQRASTPASPSSQGSGLVRVPSGADAALGWAKSKIGFKETGTNSGGLASYANSRFGMSNQPWCAMFTSLAVTKGGAPTTARTASVATVRAKAQKGDGYEKGFVNPRSAKSGDLILFGDQHIGMVDHVANGKIVYVGGNQSNGVTQASVPVGQGDIVRPKYGRRKQQ